MTKNTHFTDQFQKVNNKQPQQIDTTAKIRDRGESDLLSCIIYCLKCPGFKTNAMRYAKKYETMAHTLEKIQQSGPCGSIDV